MSVYQNEARMRSWACERLECILDRNRYPNLFAAIDAPKRRDRLTLTQLGLLRLLLDSEWRPERDGATQERYGVSSCLKTIEIAEVLNVSTSAVQRARERINGLVHKGALRDDMVSRKLGLILISDLGCCFKPNLGDTDRARNYSRKQLSAQSDVHIKNIALADEKDSEVARDREHRARFEALTPAERDRLMAKLKGAA